MPIVLVHGAWSGSWSWRGVAQILRAQGFEVFAPTLSGLAERAHIAPEHINLSSHISDVAGFMAFEDLNDVLLVGHSYGGMVITGAADREPARVKRMVYIDAFVPQSGQSVWDLAGERSRASQSAAAQAHDGGKSVPRAATPGNTGPGAAQTFGALFTPQPVRTLSEPFVSVRGTQTWPPRHYALCTQYKGSPFHAIAARVRGEPGWTYEEFDALHDVVRTHPQMVAEMIARQAEAMGIPNR